jgi:hypothetical protein
MIFSSSLSRRKFPLPYNYGVHASDWASSPNFGEDGHTCAVAR